MTAYISAPDSSLWTPEGREAVHGQGDQRHVLARLEKNTLDGDNMQTASNK